MKLDCPGKQLQIGQRELIASVAIRESELRGSEGTLCVDYFQHGRLTCGVAQPGEAEALTLRCRRLVEKN